MYADGDQYRLELLRTAEHCHSLMPVQASMKIATNKCVKWPTQIAVSENARVGANRKAVHLNEAATISKIQPKLEHKMTVEIAGLIRCRNSGLLQNVNRTLCTSTVMIVMTSQPEMI